MTIANADRGASSPSPPQDVFQAQLFELWETLLGSSDFGVDDEFHAIGGTEPLCEKMFSIIGVALGEPFRPSDRLGTLTIRHLARVLVDQLETRARGSASATIGRAAVHRVVRPQNVTQDQIAAVWETLLTKTEIGIDEDFMAIGGTPDLRERMFADLERVCGHRIGVEDVEGLLTLRNLNHALVSRLPQSAVVHSQAGRPGVPPLFFLHGDVSGGYYARELASGLGSERPVHVLQQHGMYGDDVPGSIQAMAADHAQRLREIYPDGPFHLGGFCASALIALEMALQLARVGRSVQRLLLVDPPVRTRRRDPLPVPYLSPDARRMPHIRGSWLLTVYAMRMRSYDCPVYNGKTVVFWPGDANRHVDRSQIRTILQRIVPDSEIHICRGNHISMPGRYVSELAATMKGCLARAEAPSA